MIIDSNKFLEIHSQLKQWSQSNYLLKKPGAETQARNENAVVLIGETGSGKTTALSALMGMPLQIRKKNLKQFAIQTPEGSEVQIGNSIMSETTKPNVAEMLI